MVMKGWQPQVYDPNTKPACVGMKRGVNVVSQEHCMLFSDIVVRLADAGTAAQGGCCASSPSLHKCTSREAVQQDVLAPQVHMCHSPLLLPSCRDFDNHAG